MKNLIDTIFSDFDYLNDQFSNYAEWLKKAKKKHSKHQFRKYLESEVDLGEMIVNENSPPTYDLCTRTIDISLNKNTHKKNHKTSYMASMIFLSLDVENNLKVNSIYYRDDENNEVELEKYHFSHRLYLLDKKNNEVLFDIDKDSYLTVVEKSSEQYERHKEFYNTPEKIENFIAQLFNIKPYPKNDQDMLQLCYDQKLIDIFYCNDIQKISCLYSSNKNNNKKGIK